MSGLRLGAAAEASGLWQRVYVFLCFSALFGCDASASTEPSPQHKAAFAAMRAQRDYARSLKDTAAALDAAANLSDLPPADTPPELLQSANALMGGTEFAPESLVNALGLDGNDPVVASILEASAEGLLPATAVAQPANLPGSEGLRAIAPGTLRASPILQTSALFRRKSELVEDALFNDGTHGVCDWLSGHQPEMARFIASLSDFSMYLGIGLVGKVSGLPTSLGAEMPVRAGSLVSYELMNKLGANHAAYFCIRGLEAAPHPLPLSLSGGVTLTFAFSRVVKNLIAGWAGRFDYVNLDAPPWFLPPPLLAIAKALNLTISFTAFSSPWPGGKNAAEGILASVKEGKLDLPEGVVMGVTLSLSAGLAAPSEIVTPLAISAGSASYVPMDSWTTSHLRADRVYPPLIATKEKLQNLRWPDSRERVFDLVDLYPQQVELGGEPYTVIQYRAEREDGLNSPLAQALLQKQSFIRKLGLFGAALSSFMDLYATLKENQVDCELALQADDQVNLIDVPPTRTVPYALVRGRAPASP